MTINRNKKAFTIVELIIVIAVIGVLAAILIPTFTGVIQKANAKSALSDAKNTLTAYMAENTELGELPENIVIYVHKAGAFWVYGYSKDIIDARVEGQLMQSIGNGTPAFDGYEATELARFIADHKEAGAINLNDAYTGDNFFYLPAASPSFGGIKGAIVVSPEIENGYNYLTDDLGTAATDASEVFEGYLLQGKYVVSDEVVVPAPTSTSESDPTEDVPEPTTAVPEPTTEVPATYTVTYNANGGTGTMTDSNSYAAGATVTVLANTFTYTDHEFDSWNTSADGTGTEYAPSDEITMGSASITLYAQWNEVEPIVYTYYYGNAYREADGNLNYAATLPSDGTPLNVIDSLSFTHALPNGETITRTFNADGAVTVIGTKNYKKCTETTDWEQASGKGYTLISSKAALQALQGTTLGTSSALAKYVLTCDIDALGSWNPPGLSEYAWTSVTNYVEFDGMGYTADAVTINTSTANTTYRGIGFFANMNRVTGAGNEGKIYNFNLTNANVTSTSSASSVGILVGCASSTKINNCHTSGYVSGSSPYGVGGILAYTSASTTGEVKINGCSSTAYVKGGSSGIGGIIGKCIGYNSAIEQSWFAGIVHSTSGSAGLITGGMAGASGSGNTVNNCWTSGILFTAGSSTANSRSGGIAGGNVFTVTNCYSTAKIYISGTTTTYANTINGLDAAATTKNYFLSGRFYKSGSAAGTAPNCTFNGTAATGYTTFTNTVACDSTSTLTSSAMGTFDSGIWQTSATTGLPELINNLGTVAP